MTSTRNDIHGVLQHFTRQFAQLRQNTSFSFLFLTEDILKLCYFPMILHKIEKKEEAASGVEIYRLVIKNVYTLCNLKKKIFLNVDNN